MMMLVGWSNGGLGNGGCAELRCVAGVQESRRAQRAGSFAVSETVSFHLPIQSSAVGLWQTRRTATGFALGWAQC